VVARDWWGRENRELSDGYRISILQDGKVLKIDCMTM
jgi:hypothetical protein